MKIEKNNIGVNQTFKFIYIKIIRLVEKNKPQSIFEQKCL